MRLITRVQEKETFEAIWDELTAEPEVRPSSFPQGFVLGGTGSRQIPLGRAVKCYLRQ